MILSSKKYDFVFSNPPYTHNIDISIMIEVLELAKEFIIVHPATWILDKKFKNNEYMVFRDLIHGKLRKAIMFNGNPLFGIHIQVPLMFTHIDNTYNGVIECDYFGDKFTEEDIYKVSRFGSDRELVDSFLEPIREYIKTHKTLDAYSGFAPTVINDSVFYAQLTMFSGHTYADKEDMYKPDHCTFVTKDGIINYGLRKFKENLKDTYRFKTKTERDNFLEYLKTDFARFCLATKKVSLRNGGGEFDNVPWMDFTQSWDDEKLYSFFGVTTEMKEYIESIIPKYHI